MILLLASEGGYDPGRRRGHESRVRRDGYKLETLLDHARGVLGRACEDTGGEHPFDSLDHRWFAAVHAWSMPEALAEVRGPDEDRIQTVDTENFLQVVECLPRLDHGHSHDGLVCVVGIVPSAVEGRPVRAVAAVSLRRVAAGPNEGL